MPDPSRPVYSISVAADLVGVHAQTLRKWENQGLFKPARTSGGNRRYSEQDVDEMRRHLTAGQMLTWNQLRQRVLELEDEVAELRAQLDHQPPKVKVIKRRS